MYIRITYKTMIIIVLTIVVTSLLPGAVAVWAEVNSNLVEVGAEPESLIPPTQEDEGGKRPPPFLGDMMVQYGEAGKGISPQSDLGSRVEIVPGAAFIHTNELGSGTEAKDWFFSFLGGYITNDSFAASGVNKAVCLTAPVYLPIGVKISSFKAYVRDTSAASNIAISLDRTGSRGGWTELGTVQTVNTNSSIQVLTDPSIFSNNGANIVAPEFNYQVSFCLPAGSDNTIFFYGAQVDYPLAAAPSPKNLYLPVVIKPDPLLLLSRVYITNLSGGPINYTIQGTPQGPITCNIPNGAVDQFCHKPFTAGIYTWSAQLVCGTLGPKTRDFTIGDNRLTPFRCD